MERSQEFKPEDNHDDPVTQEHLVFLKELRENLKADFPMTTAADLGLLDTDVECTIFVDSDGVVEQFEEMTEKYPELENYYNQLKEENPAYREQWMKNRAFEIYLNEHYLPKKIDEFGWGKQETIDIPRNTVITMTLDQEYLRNSIWLMADLTQPELENAERVQNFARIFFIDDQDGTLSKYREVFVKTLMNMSSGQQHVWELVVEGCKILEKSTGRHTVVPEKFEDAYKLYIKNS